MDGCKRKELLTLRKVKIYTHTPPCQIGLSILHSAFCTATLILFISDNFANNLLNYFRFIYLADPISKKYEDIASKSFQPQDLVDYYKQKSLNYYDKKSRKYYDAEPENYHSSEPLAYLDLKHLDQF